MPPISVERKAMSAEKSNALVLSPSEPPSPAVVRDMVQRIERLEDVVAVLCDTKALEDRIVQRVAAQFTSRDNLHRDYAPHVETVEMTPIKVDAVPFSHSNGMPSSSSPPTATFAEFVLPDMAANTVSTASLAGFTLPAPAKSNTVKLTLGALPGMTLLRSIWCDLRTFVAMWRDPLYTMTLAGRLMPLLAIFSVLIIPLLRKIPLLADFIPNFGDFLGNLLIILLLYLTFKVVSRELERYQAFATKYRR
jgi:hypothetical protein